jgi:uncharacterized protein (DUF1015 family)
MATVKPFAALRPEPALAVRVCELPYDVLSSSEARAIARQNPLSFFHVSKPEVDLDAGINPFDRRVYEQGRRSFFKLIAEGVLRLDEQPSFYLYQQIMGKHRQLGLVALASCREYEQNVVKRHELTRPDKEDDRVRHIEALNAQTGPAFLIYPADPTLDSRLVAMANKPPEVDFEAADSIRHSAWPVRDPETLAFVQQRFAQMPALYIADGHHRTAAAARVCAARKGAGSSGYFLSVLFPHDQVQILPYHRTIRDLNGLSAGELLKKLDGIFLRGKPGSPQPARRHELGLYMAGEWHTLHFRPDFTAATDPIEKLDVTLLQKYVLAPLFGIEDPRTSERISFVGGIRGTSELERLVRSGACACAFSMFPTSVGELMQIAEAGEIMPPKSTWFEPKLRDGLFSHALT